MTARDHHHPLHELARARAVALRAEAFDRGAAALGRALGRGAARLVSALRSAGRLTAPANPLHRMSR